MKIVYIGLQHNYYDPAKGLTFEHVNFYESWRAFPDAEVIYLPLDRILEIGKERWNALVEETVAREKPDLVFCFMFTGELDPEMLARIRRIAPTVAWFADDSWRFYNYSRRIAPHFSWAVTTYADMPEQYRAIGQKNVIRSQWACNPEKFHSVPRGAEDIDVSFIGQRTPARAKLIDMLRASGIRVHTRGLGWKEGRAGHEEMLSIFRRSKINLNMNQPPSRLAKKALGRLVLRRELNRFVFDPHLVQNAQCWWHMKTPQVKARAFELGGCNVFTISGFGDDLGAFYKEGKEMEFYRTPKELIEKIRYYLPREAERRAIAEAACACTLKEHTYAHRFSKLIREMKTRETSQVPERDFSSPAIRPAGAQ